MFYLECPFRYETCKLNADGVTIDPLTCNDNTNRKPIADLCVCLDHKFDVIDGDGTCHECNHKCESCTEESYCTAC